MSNWNRTQRIIEILVQVLDFVFYSTNYFDLNWYFKLDNNFRRHLMDYIFFNYCLEHGLFNHLFYSYLLNWNQLNSRHVCTASLYKFYRWRWRQNEIKKIIITWKFRLLAFYDVWHLFVEKHNFPIRCQTFWKNIKI